MSEIQPLISADQILAHPRFAIARDIYLREMLDLHENHPAENRLLIDGGTATIFMSVIIMDAGYRPGARATWPTLQSLKIQMEAHGIASGRRTHDIVRRLADTGYLSAYRAQDDRRVTLLAPTEKMLIHDRRALRVYYHPLHALFPDPGYPEPLAHDPDFHRGAREVCAALMAHAQAFIQANPVIAFFLPRQAGHMILTKLMHVCAQDNDQAAPQVSFLKIGDSFGVSRTHVRKLLRAAEELGFVRLSGNRVDLTAACRAGFDRFLADTMAGHDLIYRLTQASLTASEQSQEASDPRAV